LKQQGACKKVTTECKSGFCKDFLCSFSISLHKLSLEQNCYLIWQPCHYLKNCFMLVPWRFKGGLRCCGCKVSQVISRTNYLVSQFHCTNYRCSIAVTLSGNHVITWKTASCWCHGNLSWSKMSWLKLSQPSKTPP
jgi:hypothetical protein